MLGLEITLEFRDVCNKCAECLLAESSKPMDQPLKTRVLQTWCRSVELYMTRFRFRFRFIRIVARRLKITK